MKSLAPKKCSSPKRAAASNQLQSDDVGQILEVVRTLALKYSAPPVDSLSDTNLCATVRRFVRMLKHNPCLTLRVLIFALEDAGHRALERTASCDVSRGGDLC